MKKLKLGVIGSGNISKYHIEALGASNFSLEAISGSLNSESAKKLFKIYNFKKYYTSSSELVFNSSKNLDALLICCNTDNIVKYIKLAGKKIKILCEKPVSNDLKELKKIQNSFTNVRVAYNRRFYDSVNFLKNNIKKENINNYFVNIELPEKILRSRNKYKRVLENSVHIFDLMNFLFNNPEMTFFTKKLNKNKNFKIFQFVSKKKNIVNLICNWNSSSNFKIEIFFSGGKYLLQPIEVLSIFKGMKIIEPSLNIPIRTYVPTKIFQTKFDKKKLKFKPGFKLQAENFYNFVKGRKNNLANLRDAYNALSIASKVIK